jgi:hypothetical protein
MSTELIEFSEMIDEQFDLPEIEENNDVLDIILNFFAPA